MNQRIGLFVIFYSIRLLALSQSLTDLEEKAFNAYKHNDSLAIEHANRFLDASKNKRSKYSINAYTLLGILYKDKGMYVSSLEHYLKAYEHANELKDLPRSSVCLNNIGSIYQLQGNYEQAKTYFKKSLQIEDGLNNKEQKSIRYYNLAEVYQKQDSLDLALSYYNNSLQIEESLKNPEGITYALLGIGSIYIDLGRATDADITLARVELKLNSLSNDPKIMYYLLQGRLKALEGDLGASLKNYETALVIAEKTGIQIHHEEILKHKIETLKKMNDPAQLALTYERYVEILRTQNSVAIKNQLNDLTYQNEIKQKELEILLLSEQRDLAEENNKSKSAINRMARNIVILLIITLVMALLFIFYFHSKGTKQLNRND